MWPLEALVRGRGTGRGRGRLVGVGLPLTGRDASTGSAGRLCRAVGGSQVRVALSHGAEPWPRRLEGQRVGLTRHLPKARLTRVSSRPAWGLVSARPGFEPCVAYEGRQQQPHEQRSLHEHAEQSRREVVGLLLQA